MRMPGLPHPYPGQSPRTLGLWCSYANAQCTSHEELRRPPQPMVHPTPVARLHQAGGPVYPGGHGPAGPRGPPAHSQPPGGASLVIATPMVAKATFYKARGGLVLIPSAPKA